MLFLIGKVFLAYAYYLVHKLAMNSKGFGYINEEEQSDNSDSDGSVSESDEAVYGTKSKKIKNYLSALTKLL